MATVTTGYTFTANETNITHTKLNNAVNNATVTGLVAADITDSTITNAKLVNGTIDLAAKVTGVLPIANGGTAGATAAAARTALGLGTAAVLDVGTTASKVVQLDGTAKLPAVDGSQLTGFGTAAALNVGTGASQIVQLDGSAKLPAVDGSQLTNISAGEITEAFTSTEQTITLGGTLTLAHSLSSAPTLIQVRAKCQSADNGYSTGDEVMVPFGGTDAGSNTGVGVYSDATNVYAVVSTAAFMEILNKSGGAAGIADPTKWKLIIKAWK